MAISQTDYTVPSMVQFIDDAHIGFLLLLLLFLGFGVVFFFSFVCLFVAVGGVHVQHSVNCRHPSPRKITIEEGPLSVLAPMEGSAQNFFWCL